MNDIPGHISPPYSDEARDDALFHYTTAAGLIGILQTKEIWATAYYCSNDASELSVGRDVLKRQFTEATDKMINEETPLMRTFFSRGVNPRHYADNFEQMLVALAFGQLSPFMTCFCKPNDKEDFTHGLLSQWRAYGLDGGYALQLSRKKLLAAIERMGKQTSWQYDLQDVFYTPQNPLRQRVLDRIDAFIRAYTSHLETLGEPLSFGNSTMPNPIRNLFGGPLEALLDYLIHTKNGHFSEERECRLSFLEVDVDVPDLEKVPTQCFDRGGLIVPYKSIPYATFPIVDCIEWILIGPNSRISARFKSVGQMVKSSGLDIKVRPSHIPFVRN